MAKSYLHMDKLRYSNEVLRERFPTYEIFGERKKIFLDRILFLKMGNLIGTGPISGDSKAEASSVLGLDQPVQKFVQPVQKIEPKMVFHELFEKDFLERLLSEEISKERYQLAKKHGFDINLNHQTNQLGVHLLQRAFFCQRFETVKLFLKDITDLNVQMADGPPVVHAIRYGLVDLAKDLLSRGAVLDPVYDDFRLSNFRQIHRQLIDDLEEWQRIQRQRIQRQNKLSMNQLKQSMAEQSMEEQSMDERELGLNETGINESSFSAYMLHW